MQAGHGPEAGGGLAPKRIALFGSSVNPITLGHEAIVDGLLRTGRWDEVGDAPPPPPPTRPHTQHPPACATASTGWRTVQSRSANRQLPTTTTPPCARSCLCARCARAPAARTRVCSCPGPARRSIVLRQPPTTNHHHPSARPPVPPCLLRSLRARKVWVLPVYSHRYVENLRGKPREDWTDEERGNYAKKCMLTDTYEDRMRMCKAAFAAGAGAGARARGQGQGQGQGGGRRGVVLVQRHEERLAALFQLRARAAHAHGQGQGRGGTVPYPGTIDLVRWILGEARYPGDTTFAAGQGRGDTYDWVMGQDTFNDYAGGKWAGGFSLSALVGLVRIPRPGVAAGAGAAGAAAEEAAGAGAPRGACGACGACGADDGWRVGVDTLALDVPDTSSTKARGAAAALGGAGGGGEDGLGVLRANVSASVAAYIAEHGLYRPPGLGLGAILSGGPKA